MTHRDPQVEVFSESDCRITFFYIITIFLTVVISVSYTHLRAHET